MMKREIQLQLNEQIIVKFPKGNKFISIKSNDNCGVLNPITVAYYNGIDFIGYIPDEELEKMKIENLSNN